MFQIYYFINMGEEWSENCEQHKKLSKNIDNLESTEKYIIELKRKLKEVQEDID